MYSNCCMEGKVTYNVGVLCVSSKDLAAMCSFLCVVGGGGPFAGAPSLGEESLRLYFLVSVYLLSVLR